MSTNSLPDLDDLPQYRPWVEVVKTYNKCHRLLAARLDRLDLSVAKHEVLLAVYRAEGLSQKALADRLLVAKSNVTALLGRLAEDGLVRRERDDRDARGKRVYLTAAGRRLLRRAAREQAVVIALMTEGLSDRDSRQLLRLMRHCGARLDSALAER